MSQLQFTKMSGCGNDFIAINNMDNHFPEEGRQELFSKWCSRGLSVGSDGVILLEPASSSSSSFRMRYYNADGGEAATCGNGSRCMAKFAFLEGVAPAEMQFETMAGLYKATIHDDGRATVNLSDASEIAGPFEVAEPIVPNVVYSINTGVPHAVLFVDDVRSVSVGVVGHYLRYHSIFAPAGANINFAQVIDENHMSVRTYERGVEAETLACGTGSIACCIIGERLGLVKSSVDVETCSKEILSIEFVPTKDGAANIFLTGNAVDVFRGVIEY